MGSRVEQLHARQAEAPRRLRVVARELGVLDRPAAGRNPRPWREVELGERSWCGPPRDCSCRRNSARATCGRDVAGSRRFRGRRAPGYPGRGRSLPLRARNMSRPARTSSRASVRPTAPAPTMQMSEVRRAGSSRVLASTTLNLASPDPQAQPTRSRAVPELDPVGGERHPVSASWAQAAPGAAPDVADRARAVSEAAGGRKRPGSRVMRRQGCRFRSIAGR